MRNTTLNKHMPNPTCISTDVLIKWGEPRTSIIIGDRPGETEPILKDLRPVDLIALRDMLNRAIEDVS